MKNDLIIVIGADGSGKSTIVSALQDKYGYKTHHFSAPKSYEDAKDSYYSFAENANESYILDRYYEGEFVYAPLYRGYDGSDYFKDLEKVLKEKFNVLLVLAKPPFEVILKRIEERGEEFVKPEHFEYCYNKINSFFENSTLNSMYLNTDILTVDQCVHNIDKILNYYKNS